MPRRVYIARHGNRIDFVDKTWKARAERPHDPHLSPDGLDQARRLAERMRATAVRHVFASPFYRCVQTAHETAAVLGLPLKIEHGACEYLNAEWFPVAPEFLPPAQLVRDFPRVDAAYTPHVTPAWPEPNEREHTWPRCARTIRLLLERYDGDLFIVGHGATVLGLTYGLVSGEPHLTCGLTGLVELEQNGSAWTLVRNGCQAHLESTESEKRFN
ncbi:MAG: hypothetical protein AMXMBFR7_14570 [Planctomycetota bacterium]